MNTKGSVIVVYLCFLIIFTLTDCSTCQKHILEGDSLTFKLSDRLLNDDDQFTVIKENKVVVRKKNRKQYGPGIVKDDSVEIQHVNLSDSGTYSVEVVDVNGNNIKSYSEIVCVYAKIPKPRVNITCQDEKIDFRCDVEGDRDQRSNISYSWHKNGKEFMADGLNFSITVQEDKSEYTCTAQNPVHKSTSDPVEAACSDTLLGFDRWTVIGIFAGGGLVLLLMIVLVTVACCQCKRRQKQQEASRLNYINISSFPGQQGNTQSRPGPIDDEEEQLPPLPKPRKNAPVKTCEGPL